MQSRFSFNLILTIFFCSIWQNTFAQSKKIEVKNANTLEADNRVPGAQRLIGSVIFEHEGTLLYCDSAYLFDATNKMQAFSNVRIVGDSTIITGNTANYDGSTRIADIIGNVKMVDPSTILTSSALTYDLTNKIASYITTGKIIGRKNKNELTSTTGQYHSNSKTLFFRRNVVLKNPEYTMNSDTLQYNTLNETAYFFGPTHIVSKENTIYCQKGFYNTKTDISQFEKNAQIDSKKQSIKAEQIYYDRKLGIGKARVNVVISDTAEKLVLTGNKADYYEKQDRIILTDSASMQKEMSGDTLFLHGDTLRSFIDTVVNKRTLFAYYKVKFFKKDFQGIADSLIYSEIDSTIRLYGKPILWNQENQLTADTVYLQMANNQIEKLFLKKSAFIVSQEDTFHFNQLKGKNITGYFQKSELKKIDIRGNGESIYYAADDDSAYIGVNKAVCTDMLIHLDSSKVQQITFITQPVAELLPVNEIPWQELQLKGFKWLSDKRPKRKEDIFLWKTDLLKLDKTKKREKL
jgi:lipopolysaccharide export system protein LptA